MIFINRYYWPTKSVIQELKGIAYLKASIVGRATEITELQLYTPGLCGANLSERRLLAPHVDAIAWNDSFTSETRPQFLTQLHLHDIKTSKI